jgi:hypothetical protein
MWELGRYERALQVPEIARVCINARGQDRPSGLTGSLVLSNALPARNCGGWNFQMSNKPLKGKVE